MCFIFLTPVNAWDPPNDPREGGSLGAQLESEAPNHVFLMLSIWEVPHFTRESRVPWGPVW